MPSFPDCNRCKEEEEEKEEEDITTLSLTVRGRTYLISLLVFSSPVFLLRENGILVEGLLAASKMVYVISPDVSTVSLSVADTCEE